MGWQRLESRPMNTKPASEIPMDLCNAALSACPSPAGGPSRALGGKQERSWTPNKGRKCLHALGLIGGWGTGGAQTALLCALEFKQRR